MPSAGTLNQWIKRKRNEIWKKFYRISHHLTVLFICIDKNFHFRSPLIAIIIFNLFLTAKTICVFFSIQNCRLNSQYTWYHTHFIYLFHWVSGNFLSSPSIPESGVITLKFLSTMISNKLRFKPVHTSHALNNCNT